MLKADTRNSERILQITQKLNGIQANLDMERHLKMEHHDARIAGLLRTHEEFRQQEGVKFEQIKSQLLVLLKYVEDESREKEAVYEIRTAALKEFEAKVFERFELESHAKKELERKASKLLDERVAQLRHEITLEAKSRYEAIEHLKQCLEVGSQAAAALLILSERYSYDLARHQARKHRARRS